MEKRSMTCPSDLPLISDLVNDVFCGILTEDEEEFHEIKGTGD